MGGERQSGRGVGEGGGAERERITEGGHHPRPRIRKSRLDLVVLKFGLSFFKTCESAATAARLSKCAYNFQIVTN